MCQACAARFYDLSREPIVCPACGAHFVPDALRAPDARAAPFTDKTGWRRKAFRRPDPDPEPDAADAVANDNAAEDAPSPNSDEGVVLDEQDADEADVSNLVDHRDEEPNDR